MPELSRSSQKFIKEDMMKHRWKVSGILAFVLLVIVLAVLYTPESVYAISGEVEGGPPMTDSFTYQGYLEQAGTRANGYYDFDITIWDAETLGTQIASCTNAALDNVYVQDGLFTFNLLPDIAMDTVFNGEGRWLEVNVREHGAAIWTMLPRQPITAVPYAWGLRPGANIEGEINGPILSLNNTGTGSALSAVGQAPTVPAIGGVHNGDGPGVYGYTEGAYPAVEGMHGNNGVAIGGYTLGGGYGVYGHSSAISGIGVVGVQTNYYPGDTGLWKPGGFFGGRNGVIGISEENGGYGVYGQNQATTGDYSIGVYGESSSSSGWAGYFWNGSGNGVYISGAAGKTGLTVAGGTKNAVVGTDSGSHLLYSEESSEVWFSDYGFGKLQAGVAKIVIDSLFAQTVNLTEPYHVFVQVYGNAEVYVSNRTPQSFEVHLRAGDPNVEFSFRLVAKRLGYESDRLEPATWADEDPHLYPEKNQGDELGPGIQGVQP
jgi:hypothetical protein